MQIRIKKLTPDAVIPQAQRPGDAGLDLYSIEDFELKPGERHAFKTGVAMEIPMDFVGLVWDRGGLAVKHGLTTLAGVVDANYRGEIMVAILNTSDEIYNVKKGDRIAQMLIQKYESVEFVESEELSDSARGAAWSGSSGY
jgi:dUTP pyrophosphatase